MSRRWLLLPLVLAVSLSAQAAEPTSTPMPTPTPTSSSTTSSLHGLVFGPFDAGAKRVVKRQGQSGTPRAPHPMVGDVGHIPGGGPPAPALRHDPDLPELATSTPNAAPGLSSNPLYLAALFYANFLTRTDGPRCQHLPTCSRFASQAVARHGLLGIALGLDRVIQPSMSSALRALPDVQYGDAVRHYDPLENYEFWIPERFTGFPLLVPEEPLVLPEAPTASTP
jgi:hypothetical protein